MSQAPGAPLLSQYETIASSSFEKEWGENWNWNEKIENLHKGEKSICGSSTRRPQQRWPAVPLIGLIIIIMIVLIIMMMVKMVITTIDNGDGLDHDIALL